MATQALAAVPVPHPGGDEPQATSVCGLKLAGVPAPQSVADEGAVYLLY